MITIHNLHHGKPPGVGEYIGRPRTLGNPFVIGADGNRQEVIRKYKSAMWAQMKAKQGPVYEKLMSLAQRHRAGEEIKLLCHCKPLPCHGDVIKAAVEWLVKEVETVELRVASSEKTPVTPAKEEWKPSDNEGDPNE